MKRTFYIENLTPAEGNINVESTNFYGIDLPINKKIFREIHIWTRTKEISKFTSFTNF